MYWGRHATQGGGAAIGVHWLFQGLHATDAPLATRVGERFEHRAATKPSAASWIAVGRVAAGAKKTTIGKRFGPLRAVYRPPFETLETLHWRSLAFIASWTYTAARRSARRLSLCATSPQRGCRAIARQSHSRHQPSISALRHYRDRPVGRIASIYSHLAGRRLCRDRCLYLRDDGTTGSRLPILDRRV